MPNKFTSCEFSALKINNTVEHDGNSVLESLKNYYSTYAENLVKILPKALNKCSVNTVIKYYEHMIQGYHFNWTSISKNLIGTILGATQASKVAGLDSLPGLLSKGWSKFLAKPICGLCNLSVKSEKFPDLCKAAKLNPLYKGGFLTQLYNCKPISLLPLISKVIEKGIHDQLFF